MSLLADEMRQNRDALRYGYAVGKVRVLETRSLDQAALERLLDARGFAEQKRLLAETEYARYLEGAETPHEVERALDDALDGFYRFLEVAALPEAMVRFFRLRYDYANLKAVLKARLFGIGLDGLLVDHGTISTSVFAGDLAGLPDSLAAVASDAATAADAASVDDLVDRAYFGELLATARRSGSRFLKSLARLSVDIANVKTLVRARLAGRDAQALDALLIEGGSVSIADLTVLAAVPLDELPNSVRRYPALRPLAGTTFTDPAQLDPALDSLMAATLRQGRREAAGPEPVIAYVMGREAEVRVLRVLLLGTLTGIDYETLRTRLSTAMG